MAKIVMVMGKRPTTNKQTGEPVVYVDLYDMGSRSKDGRIFTAKKDDKIRTAFANGVRSPEKYAKYCNLEVGAICSMDLALDDYDSSIYVSNLEVVQPSPYTLDDIYGKV